MVVISKTILTEFGRKHADAVEPLNDWWRKVKEADWATSKDAKGTFNSVDAVGNVIVMYSTSKGINTGW